VFFIVQGTIFPGILMDSHTEVTGEGAGTSSSHLNGTQYTLKITFYLRCFSQSCYLGLKYLEVAASLTTQKFTRI
jgi:hypothetical protein